MGSSTFVITFSAFPSLGFRFNRLRVADLFFPPQPYFVHIPGILKSYLLVVGISHIWHTEIGHTYVSTHMYQIHVPVWYRSYIAHPRSPFFPWVVEAVVGS